MKVVRERKRAMMRWLAESEVMNTQHDLVVSMKDCWEASNANPVNRRNEMMVRMRGFEDYAEEQGMWGLLHLDGPFPLSCLDTEARRQDRREQTL